MRRKIIGTIMNTKFAISGQHYLFNVHAFGHLVLLLDQDSYSYAFRDRSTQGVISDVASGHSNIGVIMQTSNTAAVINDRIERAGLKFVELIKSSPRVALSKNHPLVNSSSLKMSDLSDYPYLYFEQDANSPIEFAEEALCEIQKNKSIACTDRASLSELMVAINGYTITSGILVGISDGAGLQTIPLESDISLHLGYVVKADCKLDDTSLKFVEILKQNLEKYARF